MLGVARKLLATRVAIAVRNADENKTSCVWLGGRSRRRHLKHDGRCLRAGRQNASWSSVTPLLATSLSSPVCTSMPAALGASESAPSHPAMQTAPMLLALLAWILGSLGAACTASCGAAESESREAAGPFLGQIRAGRRRRSSGASKRASLCVDARRVPTRPASYRARSRPCAQHGCEDD